MPSCIRSRRQPTAETPARVRSMARERANLKGNTVELVVTYRCIAIYDPLPPGGGGRQIDLGLIGYT
jgi:hypothetical protein